jgi:long-subunit acyl-CoA synthetase (AMP-forming)
MFFRTSFEGYSSRICLGDIDSSQDIMTVKWYTFEKIYQKSIQFGFGLHALVNKSFVGICSSNRTDWMIADFGCLFQHIVSVPIHLKSDSKFIEYVTNSTGIFYCYCKASLIRDQGDSNRIHERGP